jgi:hypothetical protein
MADFSPLLNWFTPREIRAYFFARTQAEVDQVVQLVEAMTPEHREAFRRVLYETHQMRLAEKVYGSRADS